MKKKIAKAIGAVAALLVLAAVGVRGYMVWERSQDLLPTFTPVPDGPRAPTRSFLGLELRKTLLPEAETVFRGVGADCKNSSMRVLMEAKRRDVQKAMADAKEKGEDPDAVSGASLANYRSKKERNPQIRLQCENVPLTAFTDRERAPGEPLYWLIIFDSEKHPLRHTSVSRRIMDMAVAEEEWRSAVESMTKNFGAPTVLKGPSGSGDPFPAGAYYQADWKFADVEAQVVAFRINNFVRLQERVEVPWPVTAE